MTSAEGHLGAKGPLDLAAQAHRQWQRPVGRGAADLKLGMSVEQIGPLGQQQSKGAPPGDNI